MTNSKFQIPNLNNKKNNRQQAIVSGKLFLAFDVGNTQIVVGVFKGKKLLKHWRISTNKERTADEYAIILDGFFRQLDIENKDIKGFIVSNVVPPASEAINTFGAKYLNLRPLEVSIDLKLGIEIDIDNPKELGADRIVNAVAGFEEYGGPLIIVDFGTATTFCCLDEKGRYLGGVIIPGIKISAEALYLKTAKLPRVEIKKPAYTIGKNTIEGITSGIMYGAVFQTEGFINKLKKELGNSEKIKVVATGGLAELICPQIKHIDFIDPVLTLKGLRLLLERNMNFVED